MPLLCGACGIKIIFFVHNEMWFKREKKWELYYKMIKNDGNCCACGESRLPHWNITSHWQGRGKDSVQWQHYPTWTAAAAGFAWESKWTEYEMKHTEHIHVCDVFVAIHREKQDLFEHSRGCFVFQSMLFRCYWDRIMWKRRLWFMGLKVLQTL